MKSNLLQKVIILSTVVLLIPGYILYGQDESSDIYHQEWNDLNKNGKQDPYENPSLPVDERVDDLLNRMNLEEKTCQMTTLYGYGRVLEDELPTGEWKQKIWKDGIGNIDEHLNGVAYKESAQTEYSYPYSKHAKAINRTQRFFVEETRLGIPVDFSNEGIRGLCHMRATSFPAQIGVGSTWDVDLVNSIGHITGREARILGYTNVYSPILDLARDPRWGRTVETYGENPYLVSELGKSMVNGIQDEGVVSTCKHFCIYSIPKGGRDGDARTDPHAYSQELHEIYLTPFREAITEAGAMGVMSSYNDYNGIPITGGRKFLTDILASWEFDGYIVSDSKAVGNIHDKHRVAPTYEEAVRHAVEAGLNIRTAFTDPEKYINPLRKMVREGKISMKTINERVRDVLRVKFKLDLFDDPYVENPDEADRLVNNEQAQKVSLKASRESIVLLKNEGDILPLDRDELSSVLVTGPMSKRINHSISRYGPSDIDVISSFEGIKSESGQNISVEYAEGSPVVGENWPLNEIMVPDAPGREIQAMIDEAVDKARNTDAVIAFLGETRKMVGESRSRTSLDLPYVQRELLKALHKTGKPVVLVLMNGRPLTINWANRNISGIIEAWFPGKMCGKAIADVIFGEYNPSGKLPVTFPKTVGQIPLNFPYKPGSHASQASWQEYQSEEGTRVEGTLYPFGYGLSYTEFSYDNAEISSKKIHNQGTIRIDCEITNTGDRYGTEIVQLYLNDEYSSITTWVKKLRGFKRVSLKPGETKKITFTLKPDDLAMVNKDEEWVVEPGMFNVMIGSSSEDIRISESFEVVK
jgi:beta-glucosidase